MQHHVLKKINFYSTPIFFLLDQQDKLFKVKDYLKVFPNELKEILAFIQRIISILSPTKQLDYSEKIKRELSMIEICVNTLKTWLRDFDDLSKRITKIRHNSQFLKICHKTIVIIQIKLKNESFIEKSYFCVMKNKREFYVNSLLITLI